MLSIIIVNWNVASLVERCLFSLSRHIKGIDWEVIVVDNNSQDTEKAILKRLSSQFPRLQVIFNSENKGFSAANNQGARLAQGEYLLFLNPDTEFINNPFPQLIAAFRQNSSLGAATVKFIYPDHTLQSNIKGDPTFLSQFFIYLKLHHLGKPSFLRKYLQKDFNYSQEAVVEQIMGAFIFMPRQVFEKIGGWSEDYFLWWEDIDLCFRLRKKGYLIKYFPWGPIIHHEGKSFYQQLSLKKQRMFNKGLRIFWRKYRPFGQYLLFLVFNPLSLFLAWLVQILKIGPKPQSKL